MVMSHRNLRVREQLTGEASQAFVRDLRIAYDAVAVGAHTVAIDDPQLTVRPPHDREREYVRLVFCRTSVPDRDRAIFERHPGYAKTVLVVPEAHASRYNVLRDVAEIVAVGKPGARTLDLDAAFRELRKRGIESVLCEAGPQFATALLQAGVVDRLYWLISPKIIGNEDGVRGFSFDALRDARLLRFDRTELLGKDALLTLTLRPSTRVGTSDAAQDDKMGRSPEQRSVSKGQGDKKQAQGDKMGRSPEQRSVSKGQGDNRRDV